MKIKIILFGLFFSLFSISPSVFAVLEGPYVGIDVGASTVKATSSSGALTPNQNTGIGIDAIIGMQMGLYGGLELGFTHYSNVKNQENTLCDSSQAQTNSFDILGKGIYPFGSSGFSAFAKAGLAVVRTSGDAEVTSPGHCSSKNETLPRAKAGLGVSYDITQKFVADITWTRAFINSSFVKSADLFAIGISYHFVDTYCGQFLC